MAQMEDGVDCSGLPSIFIPTSTDFHTVISLSSTHHKIRSPIIPNFLPALGTPSREHFLYAAFLAMSI